MAPLRCWKELFLGERASRLKKNNRASRPASSTLLTRFVHASAAE
jgi:hypothetical protein